MKTIYLSILLVLFSISSIYAQDHKYYPNRLIVKLKSDIVISMSSELFEFEGQIPKIEILGSKTKVYANSQNQSMVLEYKKPIDIKKAIKYFMDKGIFEYVEPDYEVQAMQTLIDEPKNRHNMNDPNYNLCWQIINMELEKAWLIERDVNHEVIVAVVDSGINYNHNDLSSTMWENEDESDNGIDTDSNGYKGDIRGWDFIEDDNNPMDYNGHGTHVAGSVGALHNNEVAVVGIGHNITIMNLRVLNANGSGYVSGVIKALHYASDNGANIINLSIGGPHSRSYLEAIDEVYEDGVIMVAAMGNTGTNVRQFPAAYLQTIAVGNTKPDDTLASNSTRGDHIDVSAPGTWIKSCSHTDNNGYVSKSGTSMATPQVAGLAALLLKQDPERDIEDIRDIIRDTADDLGAPGHDIYFGTGRINIYEALLYECNPRHAPNPNYYVDERLEINNAIQFFDFSTNCPDSWEWDISGPQSFHSTDQNPNFTFNRAGSYTLELSATNSIGTGTITRYFEIHSKVDCYPKFYSPWLEIYRVKFGSIDHISPFDTSNRNKDYTSMEANLLNEGRYKIEVWAYCPNMSWTLPMRLQVWIDYNQDSKFQNEELVFMDSKPSYHYGSILRKFEKIITLKEGAPKENVIMRFLISYDDLRTGSCNQYYREGESEDYSINIIHP